MIPGSKGRNVVHACMIRHLNFGPAKHEEAAIYAVNQRIPNVCRIVGVAKQRNNPWASVGDKIPFAPNIIVFYQDSEENVMIKLVATDIDGTLLDEGTDRLNPELFDIVRDLKEKGIIFAAASGRQYASIRRLFDPVAHDMIFIAENGAYVVCRDVDMLEVMMDRTKAAELVQEIRRMKGCEVAVAAKDAMYIERADTGLYDLLVNGYHNQVKVVEDVLKEDIPMIKVSIYCRDGVDGISQGVKSRWEGTFRTMLAGQIWIDFADYSADKGKAIQSIQKSLLIDRSETMAFGDNGNDLGMLANAEESYAIGNAREEVKKAAKHIADTSRNDGVLKVLRKLVKTDGN